MEVFQGIPEDQLTAEAYRLLSACFCLPQKELFVQEGLFKNLTSIISQVCSEAAPYASRMEQSFLDTTEEELKIEYARLFVGPYELKAPPYGSVYLDGERRLMGESTLEVIRFYEKAGLAMDQDSKEPPDHISLELEFMYYLTYKEVEALKKFDEKRALDIREVRKDFLNRFLKPWIPSFCDKMKESTDNLYYRALADCLFTFINSERNKF